MNAGYVLLFLLACGLLLATRHWILSLFILVCKFIFLDQNKRISWTVAAKRVVILALIPVCLPLVLLGLILKVALERNSHLNIRLNGQPAIDDDGKVLRIPPGPCFLPSYH